VVPVPGDGAAERVEFDAGRAEDAGMRGGPAPGQAADAEDELVEAERFGQVVGAEAQPGHAVVRGAGRGEHEDHGGVVVFGDHPAYCVAVQARQVAVEDDDVVAVQAEPRGGFQPVVGDVDGHGLVAQRLLGVSSVQPVLFVLLFRYVFGGAIHAGGASYIDYLLPGILVTAALFGATTSVAMATDLAGGMIDRFRSLPMSRTAVLAGRCPADDIRSIIVVALVLIWLPFPAMGPSLVTARPYRAAWPGSPGSAAWCRRC
jgi:hypothetical protein